MLRDITFTKSSIPALELIQPPLQCVPEILGRSKGGSGARITTPLYLVPMLRKNGALMQFHRSARLVIVNATVTQYTSSVNGVSLPTYYPQGGVTVRGCPVRSTLTGCQVTSRPRDRFSRYSKWLDTLPTAFAYPYFRCMPSGRTLFTLSSNLSI